MPAPDWKSIGQPLVSTAIVSSTLPSLPHSAHRQEPPAVSAVVNRKPLRVEHEHIASPGDSRVSDTNCPSSSSRGRQIECTGDLPTTISCIQQDEINTLVFIRRSRAAKRSSMLPISAQLLSYAITASAARCCNDSAGERFHDRPAAQSHRPDRGLRGGPR